MSESENAAQVAKLRKELSDAVSELLTNEAVPESIKAILRGIETGKKEAEA